MPRGRKTNEAKLLEGYHKLPPEIQVKVAMLVIVLARLYADAVRK